MLCSKITVIVNDQNKEHGKKIAIIENEFGEVAIDDALISKNSKFASDKEIVEVLNGCVCCTVRGDLVNTLRDMVMLRQREDVPSFDRVLIETTGLADPAPILHTLMSDQLVTNYFRLDGVITTVDAVNAEASHAGAPGGGALALLDGEVGGSIVVALVVSSCAIAPVLEELFFRGFALPACERTVGNAWLSVTCTAGLFAAVHFSVKDAPSLFVAGCFFGLAAVDANGRAGGDANRRDGATGVRGGERDGRVVGLAAPTAAHATFNAGVLLEAVLHSG